MLTHYSIHAAFLKLLAAPAGARLVSSNFARTERGPATGRCSPRHALGDLIHYVVPFPRKTKVEPKLRKPVIRTNDKAEPATSAVHIFPPPTMLGQSLSCLCVGERSAMNRQASAAFLERECEIMGLTILPRQVSDLIESQI